MSSSEAIAAVTALTARLGLRCAPRVIAERSNLVLALDPHPLVARVAMATAAARMGDAWLRREVDIAQLIGPALSTTPASTLPPGPHTEGAHLVSFWEREVLIGPVEGAAAGARLAACHRALRAYPPDALPRLGFWDEVRAIRERVLGGGLLNDVERARVERALAAAERVLDGLSTGSLQAVHGDAHLGNVLATTRGTLWTDWEDAFVGPIEYDLACLRSKRDLFGEDREAIDAALAAYDVEHDPSLVEALGPVRNVQVIVWLTLFAERQPELMDRARQRISALPR